MIQFLFFRTAAGLFGDLFTPHISASLDSSGSKTVWIAFENVVPVFWTDSDDHDFEEVKSLGLKTSDGSPFLLEYTLTISFPARLSAKQLWITGHTSDRCPLLKHYSGERATIISKLSVMHGSPESAGMMRSHSRWLLFFILGACNFRSAVGWNKKNVRPDHPQGVGKPAFFNYTRERRGCKFESAVIRSKALRKPKNSTNVFFETNGVRSPVLWKNDKFTAGKMNFQKISFWVFSIPNRKDSAPALPSDRYVRTRFSLRRAYRRPGERIYLEQLALSMTSFRWRYLYLGRGHRSLFSTPAHWEQRKRRTFHLKLFLKASTLSEPTCLRKNPSRIEIRYWKSWKNTVESYDRVSRSIRSLDPTLSAMVEKEKAKALRTIGGIEDARSIRAKREFHWQIPVSLESHTSPAEDGPQERWFGLDAIYPVLGDEGLKN